MRILSKLGKSKLFALTFALLFFGQKQSSGQQAPPVSLKEVGLEARITELETRLSRIEERLGIAKEPSSDERKQPLGGPKANDSKIQEDLQVVRGAVMKVFTVDRASFRTVQTGKAVGVEEDRSAKFNVSNFKQFPGLAAFQGQAMGVLWEGLLKIEAEGEYYFDLAFSPGNRNGYAEITLSDRPLFSAPATSPIDIKRVELGSGWNIIRIWVASPPTTGRGSYPGIVLNFRHESEKEWTALSPGALYHRAER
jgi:hypothetical protein